MGIIADIHKDLEKGALQLMVEYHGCLTVEADELERYAGADWSTDEQLLRNSDSEAIRAAIAGMDPKYNQVLMMRYYDESTLKQITDRVLTRSTLIPTPSTLIPTLSPLILSHRPLKPYRRRSRRPALTRFQQPKTHKGKTP